MNIVDIEVPLAYCLVPSTPRPITGVFLHSTVTSVPARCRVDGSWHWQVCRDGTIERHVDEANIAFGVRACDRWRPDWVVPSPYNASDANYCGVHIELESFAGHPDCPADYPAYLAAQYAGLWQVLDDIKSRYGVLPIVGHGQVQADRSDPVEFDWRQLAARISTGDDDVSKEDQAIVAAARARGLNRAQDVHDLCDWSGGIWEQNEALRTQVEGLTGDVQALSDQISNPPSAVVRVVAPANVSVVVGTA